MIELSEHATIVAEGPAPQQRIEARIRRLLRNKIDLRWLAGDRVEIRASSWIGVVQLPTGQAIRVRPKLAGDELRVLVMLGVVNALPVDEIADLVRDLDDAPQGDARELLARLVVRTAHRVLATGLIRDYRPDTDDLPYLRGRLVLRRQALRHLVATHARGRERC